jgi:hypothetical protein
MVCVVVPPGLLPRLHSTRLISAPASSSMRLRTCTVPGSAAGPWRNTTDSGVSQCTPAATCSRQPVLNRAAFTVSRGCDSPFEGRASQRASRSCWSLDSSARNSIPFGRSARRLSSGRKVPLAQTRRGPARGRSLSSCASCATACPSARVASGAQAAGASPPRRVYFQFSERMPGRPDSSVRRAASRRVAESPTFSRRMFRPGSEVITAPPHRSSASRNRSLPV